MLHFSTDTRGLDVALFVVSPTQVYSHIYTCVGETTKSTITNIMEECLQNDLFCVKWDVKPCSISISVMESIDSKKHHRSGVHSFTKFHF